MELRSCTNLHFINAITGGLVKKACNVNSRSNPSLVFKKMEDIYQYEGLHSSSDLNNGRVKIESQFLPLVDRTLHEIEAEKNEAFPCGMDGEMGSDSDEYTFGKMTLKELKKNLKSKKRKRACSQLLNPERSQLKLEHEDDGSDLKEPLISFKLKLPKAKKKSTRNGSQSPGLSVSFRPESQDLESESLLQFHEDLLVAVHVKTEVGEPEISVSQRVISSVHDSFTVNHKDVSNVAEVRSEGIPAEVACQTFKPNIYGEEYQNCTLNEAFNDLQKNVVPSEVMSEGNLSEVECQTSKSDLFGKKYQICSFNKVSYDHLEDVEPISVLVPSDEEIMDVNNEERRGQHFPHLPRSEFGKEKNIQQSTSPIKEPSSVRNGCSSSSDLNEIPGQGISSAAVQVPHAVVDESTSREETCHGGISFQFRDTSNTDEVLLLSKYDKSEEPQQSECRMIVTENKNLSDENPSDPMENELYSCDQRQPPLSASIPTGGDSHSWNQSFTFGEISSSSVLAQTSERLLSTRKVVSPTCDERFCLAMTSAGSFGDMNLLDYNKDLCNGLQTENHLSCEESYKDDIVSKSPKVSVTSSRAKFILSPSHIRRRPKHERTPPPKGNLEGARISHSIPSISTGCTSVQDCSENAIAFSRRQLLDIEYLATKLMNELKSIKDLVEEKLPYEAYRNLDSKCDADEVKNATTKATKAEETAKKWLSIMRKDCNRFCKIMSLTQKGNAGAASSNTTPKERKRITFADEAGGMLCHVKFFENE